MKQITIMVLASPQSRGGIWMSGRATSFRKPTSVLRWPASHTHIHIMLCLEMPQQMGCSPSQQTQMPVKAFLRFLVVSEYENTESRSPLTGFTLTLFFWLKYLLLVRKLSFWTLTPKTGHSGLWNSSERPWLQCNDFHSVTFELLWAFLILSLDSAYEVALTEHNFWQVIYTTIQTKFIM